MERKKQMDTKMEDWIDRKNGWLDGYTFFSKIDGWLDGQEKQKDGWMDRQMNGWMNIKNRLMDG